METLKVAPFQLIGPSLRITNENGNAAEEIGALWNRFLSEGLLEKIPNKVDATIYSLYTDYEEDHTKGYTVVLGCKVHHLDEIPAGMTGRSFTGGTYAKISVKGDLSKGLIIDQWAAIWQMDLKRRYTADFEVFGEKAQNPQEAEVDFYIAIE